MKMKVYKLLKGVPGCRAGTIGRWDGYQYRFEGVDGNYTLYYSQKIVENDPDFFGEVNDEWPKDGDTVYTFGRVGEKYAHIWGGEENPLFGYKTPEDRDRALEALLKLRKEMGY